MATETITTVPDLPSLVDAAAVDLTELRKQPRVLATLGASDTLMVSRPRSRASSSKRNRSRSTRRTRCVVRSDGVRWPRSGRCRRSKFSICETVTNGPEQLSDTCSHCGGELAGVDLREHLVQLAERTGCGFERVSHHDQLSELGGVGCLLRHARPGRT